MRKLMCIALSLLLIATLPFSALAVSAQDSNEMVIAYQDPDMIAYFPDTSNPIYVGGGVQARAAIYSFAFDDYNTGVMVPSPQSFVIPTTGSHYLNVVSCNWAPSTNNIELGFYNINTGTRYKLVFTNGYLVPDSYEYTIPSGTYWVYAMNLGAGRLTSGTIYYSID